MIQISFLFPYLTNTTCTKPSYNMDISARVALEIQNHNNRQNFSVSFVFARQILYSSTITLVTEAFTDNILR